MLDLQPIIEELRVFREERDWQQFHNPKDLAISISLEAAELLEVFQWSGPDTSSVGREEKIHEELADVLIYCLNLADVIGADPIQIMREKIAVNRTKYPANAPRGTIR